ncbi:uncharacterized protein ACJ7VT_000121 isoform 2-T2 [Polymixia lowei]
MSTSDSDYSIDWLASDEEDYDSPNRLSPQETDTHPPPSSTTSLRESPRDGIHAGPIQTTDDDCDSKDGDHHRPKRESEESTDSSSGTPATLETPWAAPVQGYTCVGQQIPSWAFRTTSEGTVTGKHHQMRKRAHSPVLEGLCEKLKTEDTEKLLFSQKCTELQCYIQPLSSILRGLRSGRYSERLSSFQESVAMDRIQRIMGVLQNPNMGERFLSIVLKIEDMLQSWFPHVKPDTRTDDSSPAKKQKHHTSAATPPLCPASLCSSGVDHSSRASDGRGLGPYYTTHLKWLHASPICFLKTSGPTLDRPAASLPLTSCHLETTQDNAVSSSTDSQTGPLRHPNSNTRPRQGILPFKISSPCLERLLQAKESLIAPRTVGDGGTNERSWSL